MVDYFKIITQYESLFKEDRSLIDKYEIILYVVFSNKIIVFTTKHNKDTNSPEGTLMTSYFTLSFTA